MTSYETFTVVTSDLRLSLLVWKRFKRPMFGMVERILALNPGIAQSNPFLPVGAKVVIPIDPAPANVNPSRPVIQLWD